MAGDGFQRGTSPCPEHPLTFFNTPSERTHLQGRACLIKDQSQGKCPGALSVGRGTHPSLLRRGDAPGTKLLPSALVETLLVKRPFCPLKKKITPFKH